MKNHKVVWIVLVLILITTTVLAVSGIKIGGGGVVYKLRYNKHEKEVIAMVVNYKGNNEHVTIAKRYMGFPVRRINSFAFDRCENLRSVTIPETVVTIEGGAFNACQKLTSIIIPKSVTSIDYSAFSECRNLVEIVNYGPYDAHHHYAIEIYNGTKPFLGTKLTNDNEYIIYNDGKEKILVAYFGEETDLVVPSYVTKINGSAFYKCKQLTSIVLPSGLKSIGEFAFNYCESLQSIVIPQNTVVGRDVFYGSTHLTIFCEASSQPSDWEYDWNGFFSDSRPTYWAGEWHYDANGNPVPNN